MKKLMIRPDKELLRKKRISEKNNGPQYEQRGSTVPWLPESVQAGVIQLPLPAAVRPIFFYFYDLF